MANAAMDLPSDDEQSRTASTANGSRTRIAGIEQHADGDEEEHGERVLQRQGVGRRLVAEVGLAEHDAGEERAQRERDAEELGRAEGDAERDREHRQGEQLARAGARDLLRGATA